MTDVYISNGADWSMTYVGMFRSTGTDLVMTTRYDGDIPGWGGLAVHDQLYVGDFDADGRADLYIFNGTDWAMPYLGMFRSTGSDLQMTARYDGDVPGWGRLARNDRFFPADITSDGKIDLFAYNSVDWSEEYLGRLISTGAALSGDYVADWVGEWNLGPSDAFETCSFEGAPGKPDLFVHTQDWFGMIRGRRGRGQRALTLERLYFRWIHNYRYGRNW